MPLYIKDNATVSLVDQLAKKHGTTKTEAVKLAVQAELERANAAVPLVDQLEAFWAANPLPPPTGQQADKAFFDDLSGELR